MSVLSRPPAPPGLSLHTFRVWAPQAEHVDVLLPVGGGRVAMSPARCGGWWQATVADAGAGTDYLFSLDMGPPRPDPRSCFQPEGIDGPSRVVDHGSFEWSDRHWGGTYLPSAVLYELHVGTFTSEGTFEAAIGRLGHIADLGATAVELMPVAEFSGDHGWGYDGVDLYAPHHAYGGPQGLKTFIDACHEVGLGVVMDVVYNHLGPAGNYLAEFGPYFTRSHTTNWGDAVNFDGPGSDEVREFVLSNAVMWLRDYHCDGLRLDAVHAIKDDSALTMLEQLSGRVRRLAADLGRPLFLIAESDRNDPRYVLPAESGGFGLDAGWADEFHHSIHAALTGDAGGYYSDFGPLSMVARASRQAWVYAGEYSPHRRRTHGRPPDQLTDSRFVVFLQNHDQVGNRAAGDRIGEQLSTGRAMIGAALTLLSSFVPMLFMGEEWRASTPFQYFTDHKDPDLGSAVSGGRRQEFAAFGWKPGDVPDPQAVGTFLASKLDWGERAGAAHAEMLAWYRDLIALRKAVPRLDEPAGGKVRTRFDEADRWLVVERPPLVIGVNLSDCERHVPVPPGGRIALASHPRTCLPQSFDSGADPIELLLAPDSVAVLEYPPLGEECASRA